MDGAMETLLKKRWAFLDIEFIQTSPTHQCIRKVYILRDNGLADMEMEFCPCVKFKDLEKRYQRAFNFCQKRIHKLGYEPELFAPECSTAKNKINEFIFDNGIELILYKGGTIERDLCEGELFIPSLDIECFPIEKTQSHDPRTVVEHYHSRITKMLK